MIATRPLLFPGSQYAPAGGARRHRGSHRHRPGGMDGACQAAGEIAFLGKYSPAPQGVFHPGSRLCRGPGSQIFSPAPAACPGRMARRRRASKHGSNRAPKSLLITTPCSPRSSCAAEDRAVARSRNCALRSTRLRISGIETNLEYLRQVMRGPGLRGRRHHAPRSCAASDYRRAPSK